MVNLVGNGDTHNKVIQVQKTIARLESQDSASSLTVGQQYGVESRPKFNSLDEMFEGRSIFLTGGSGFLGRVLLAKLLGTFPGIKRIYILLRPKKGVPPEVRVQKDITQLAIFDEIRARPNGQEILDKIEVVSGELSQRWFGIGKGQLDRLISDATLSIVIHSAATVRFDEPLKKSVDLNLAPTRTMIDLCKKLPYLISFCHISTCYVNADIRDSTWIEERLYPINEDPVKIIQLAKLLDEKSMDKLRTTMVDQRPNTYTFTKALAEHLIAQEASELPVVIVRPAIVVASVKEPVEGWVDNVNGPTGLIAASAKGILQSVYGNPDGKADLIPVDICVNTIIAATYYGARNCQPEPKMEASPQVGPRVGQLNRRDSNLGRRDSYMRRGSTMSFLSYKQPTIDKEPFIVHCNSGHVNPIHWKQIEDYVRMNVRKNPSKEIFRYPRGIMHRYYYLDLFMSFMVHFLPAMLLDTVLQMAGKKRFLIRTYARIYSALSALSHFLLNNYNFETINMGVVRDELTIEDQKKLYMDIDNLQWEEYFDTYVLGIRRYIFREDDADLDQARRSMMRQRQYEKLFYLAMFIFLGIPLLWTSYINLASLRE